MNQQWFRLDAFQAAVHCYTFSISTHREKFRLTDIDLWATGGWDGPTPTLQLQHEHVKKKKEGYGKQLNQPSMDNKTFFQHVNWGTHQQYYILFIFWLLIIFSILTSDQHGKNISEKLFNLYSASHVKVHFAWMNTFFIINNNNSISVRRKSNYVNQNCCFQRWRINYSVMMSGKGEDCLWMYSGLMDCYGEETLLVCLWIRKIIFTESTKSEWKVFKLKSKSQTHLSLLAFSMLSSIQIIKIRNVPLWT